MGEVGGGQRQCRVYPMDSTTGHGTPFHHLRETAREKTLPNKLTSSQPFLSPKRTLSQRRLIKCPPSFKKSNKTYRRHRSVLQLPSLSDRNTHRGAHEFLSMVPSGGSSRCPRQPTFSWRVLEIPNILALSVLEAQFFRRNSTGYPNPVAESTGGNMYPVWSSPPEAKK